MTASVSALRASPRQAARKMKKGMNGWLDDWDGRRQITENGLKREHGRRTSDVLHFIAQQLTVFGRLICSPQVLSGEHIQRSKGP